MSESVVSPTPVFMGEINRGPFNSGIVGPSVIGGTSAVALHTDVPALVLAGQAELRHQTNANASAIAATQLRLADFRTEVADRFAALTTDSLKAKIADMQAASQASLLSAIASKVGAVVVGA